MMNQNHYTYDIEVYKNVFTCVIYGVQEDEYLTYEVSERQNDFSNFIEDLFTLARNGASMVGFNNIGYDYPVVHALINLWKLNRNADWETVTRTARGKSDDIINCPFEHRFSQIIWPRDRFVPQIDLYKIHHFDNIARATSLKGLEFAMRSKDVGDLPFDVDHELNGDEIDELLRYNKHDVSETHRFYLESLEALEFREQLGEKFDKDFTNHNDTKIGKDIFVIELEKELGDDACFEWVDKKRKPRQTPRAEIQLSQVVLPYAEFKRQPFKEVLKWFKRQVIYETKGVFTEIPTENLGALAFFCNDRMVKKKIKNLNCIVDGIQFDFGTGGLHACIEPGIYRSDEEFVIIDLDVTSYYPSLAIENTVFPEHLGETFCDVYEDLKQRRMSFKKGTPENAALKLALNGVYGDSNNQYSPFYDPFYTMTITINGQLLLCMLSERVMEIEGLQFLQANTDGITVRIPRDKVGELDDIREWWEKETQLQLEDAVYSRMFIRDVNNYLAEYENGDVKRKGAYEYKVGWHQNHSNKVSTKAAEAYLLHGTDIEKFIEEHDDPYDFYILGKCDRSSQLILRYEEDSFNSNRVEWSGNTDNKPKRGDELLQRINRYYCSNTGGTLMKIMNPLPKKISKKLEEDWTKLGVEFTEEQLKTIRCKMKFKQEFGLDDLGEVKMVDPKGKIYFDLDEDERLDMAIGTCQPRHRYIGQCNDSFVTVHNTIAPLVDVNTDYYVNEAKKLVEPLEKNL